LDEVLLIIRKSSKLRFDEKIGGFHLYATDLCLEAESRGMKNYAISAFGIHNSNAYKLLPVGFWQCYLQLRKKWKKVLPVVTPCIRITFWCWPIIHYNITQSVNLLLKRLKSGSRVADPSAFYRELVGAGIAPRPQKSGLKEPANAALGK